MPSPLIAAVGRTKLPISVEFFVPPHFPRNKTAFGWTALSKSMIVAALAEPMPKLIMVSPSLFVQVCIGQSKPRIGAPNSSENLCMYSLKLVRRSNRQMH